MPIWGVDIHPRYQAGISIEQIRRESFDFMAVPSGAAAAVSVALRRRREWIRLGHVPAAQSRRMVPLRGLGVEVLQFTNRAIVAGRQIDADHYRGTREFGFPGGWVHEAKWWVRGGTGVGAVNKPHTPVSVNFAGFAGQERHGGMGWQLSPPDRADELILLSDQVVVNQ